MIRSDFEDRAEQTIVRKNPELLPDILPGRVSDALGGAGVEQIGNGS